MPSEITTASPDWPALKGKVLDGGYEVGECLLTTPDSASFKVRVLGDRFAQVVVNVFASEAAPLEQVALWQEAMQLHHPNISAPITVGRLEWNGAFYPYVLLHKADENLAGVITERALTPAETRELLRSVGAALEHLHANGFVHSSLAPEHVLAMGDAIKVSSTSIRRINTPLDEEGESGAAYRAPESASENLTVPADIWCLGATLFEVLTQRKCEEDCRERAQSLPAPFDWIVERCLEPEPHERPTFSEVFAMLSGAVRRPEKPKPELVVEQQPAAVAASAAPPSSVTETPATAETTAAESAPAPAPVAAMAAAAGAAGPELAVSGTATLPAKPSTGPVVIPVETAKTATPAAPPANKPQANQAPAPASNRAPRPSVVPKPAAAAGAAASRPVSRPPTESPRPKLTSTPKPVYTENRPRRPSLLDEKPQESPRTKFISYAILAVVLVAGLLWLARPKSERAHPTVNPAARTQTAAPAATPGSNAPAAPSPANSPAAAASSTAGTAAGTTPEIWRVVVFTYDRKDAADQRVQALNRQHPGFNPEVFSKDGSGPFLVVLGGPMTHDQANRMRLKARASGFPRDAYVQNFSH